MIAYDNLRFWEITCMTLLESAGKKCPDFDKLCANMPGAFKDSKAARNRWELLVRKMKSRQGGSRDTAAAPSTPTKRAKRGKLCLLEEEEDEMLKCSADELEATEPKRKRKRKVACARPGKILVVEDDAV